MNLADKLFSYGMGWGLVDLKNGWLKITDYHKTFLLGGFTCLFRNIKCLNEYFLLA
jgi:hypothetical protein